jgi:Flp pilus assembly protein TadG
MDASRTLKNSRGIAVVYLALLLFALVGFAALSIDVGYFYVVKGQLQNAADAAALAGGSGLKGGLGVNPYSNETTARIRARYFAQQNNAEGTPVLLDINTANINTGDILIGCWNKSTSTMSTSCTRPNSIQVRARRSTDAGVGSTPVSTFFGKIFNINTINIGSIAVAQRPTKPTIPIAICSPALTGACDSTVSSYTFYFHDTSQGQSSYPLEMTAGWTAFSFTKDTDLGPNSTIAKFIEGTAEIPENVCKETIFTNTGIGNVITLLKNEYVNKNINGRWAVILPIFETCPSASQPTEGNNKLLKFAQAFITNVDNKSKDTSITVEGLSCEDCATANFLSDTCKLVK